MDHPSPPPLVVHLVSHTHWDREWYRSAEEFRLALVDLVDEVLDGPAGTHFLLDGQAIVLVDYLAARPERADDVRAALRDGRIEAGPWFVLGDNLLVGGEALVRNLLAGRAVLAEVGGSAPSVLYCPDAFGHPAALPRLAAGFGARVCVVWRGYGGAPWPPGDSARWRERDGSRVLLHHLAPDGYELGANLPSDPAAARATWERLQAILAPRATLGVAFLPNGADHHAVQDRRADAVAALAQAASPVPIVDGALQTLADALVAAAASTRLPVVTGELRRSPDYAWSLQGTFGSRAAQKRQNASAERLLVHYVEPQCALAWWRDGRSRRHETRALWRTLLACHPHDTLCGCSIDAVAEAMDRRLGEVHRAGALVARRAQRARLDDDPAAARAHLDAWRPVVIVRNDAARPRGGIVELELDEPLAVVAVGPGSGDPAAPAHRRRPLQLDGAGYAVQALSRERQYVRHESPRHYPRNELVLRRRLLAWLPPVRAMALETIPLVPQKRARAAGTPRADDAALRRIAHPVLATDRVLDNDVCRVAMEPSRTLSFVAPDGRTFADLLALEVVGDRGDLYTHSPIPGTHAVGTITTHRIVRRGPLRATWRLTMRAVLPARTLHTATGEVRRNRATAVVVVVDVSLDAGASRLDVRVHGDHRADDCRVRLLLRTGIEQPEVRADAAFGEVARPRPSGERSAVPGTAREAEVRTAPLHRYVTLVDSTRGVTVLSDGLAEYEAFPDGTLAVTLVRSVGELARGDLPERPGFAGWPVATPGAQSHGSFEARVALLAHGPASDHQRAAVRDAMDDFLLPLTATTWGSAIAPPRNAPGLQLTGERLAFEACKESEDGRSLVVRCTNTGGTPAAGRWQLAGVREAWLARLDETPLGALPVRDGGVAFTAPPRATVTILLRR